VPIASPSPEPSQSAEDCLARPHLLDALISTSYRPSCRAANLPWVPRVVVLAWCLSQLERRDQTKVPRRGWSTVVTNIEDVNRQKRRPCRVQTWSSLRLPRCSTSELWLSSRPSLKRTQDLKKYLRCVQIYSRRFHLDLLSALCLPLASTAGYAICHLSDKFCGRLTLR